MDVISPVCMDVYACVRSVCLCVSVCNTFDSDEKLVIVELFYVLVS